MKQHGDLVGRVMSWCRLVESCIYEWRDLALLDEWLDEIQTLDNDVINRLPLRTARHFTCAMFSALLFRRPHDPNLGEWAEQVNTLVMTDEDASLRFSIGPTLLMYYTWFIGSLNRAGLIFNALRPIAEQPDVPPLVQTSWNYMAAGYCWVMGRLHDALNYAETGLRIAEASGVHVWDILTNMQALCAAIVLENRALAERYLEAMHSCLDMRRTLDSATYHHMAAWHYLAFDDAATAHEHAKLALTFTEKGGFPSYELYAAAMLARTCATLGKYQQAAMLIEKTLAKSWAAKAYPVMFLCLLAKAELELVEGREDKANESLQQALKLAAHQLLVSSTWTPTALRPLFSRALEHGIETDYVRYVISKLNIVPDESMMLLESWPWRLKIYTLGRFSLIRDDAVVEFPVRAQGKVLDTLKTLIALGGRGVPQIQLAEALWPDADGDAALHNLETTLMRLRRLLGIDEAIQVQDRHVSLNTCFCWLDIWAFEHLVGQLNSLSTALSDMDVAAARKALALYHGAFLGANSRQAWAAGMAARLHSKFLRCIIRLSDHYQQASAWDEAINCYQQALEIDPLDEPCYRHLMRCYARQGQSDQAVTTYRRCREILATTLGVMPSAETQSLYRELTHQ
jgi:DNA-binding SARP family transcriptional activator